MSKIRVLAIVLLATTALACTIDSLPPRTAPDLGVNAPVDTGTGTGAGTGTSGAIGTGTRIDAGVGTGGATGTSTRADAGLPCADPANPVYCGAIGTFPGGCWASTTVCSTITNCGTSAAPEYRACVTAGYHPDCGGTICLPSSVLPSSGGSGGAVETGGASGGATGTSAPADASPPCADPACLPNSGGSGVGSGGTTGNGGTTAGRGTTTSNGGIASTGGSSSTGGTKDAGGATSAGGSAASSGTAGAGATAGASGTTSSTVAGGTTPTGGSTAAGGTTASSSSAPDGSYYISGVWHGYMWTAVSPTGSAITPSDFSDIAPGSPFCAAGTVAGQNDSSGVGMIGFSVNQAQGVNMPQDTWQPSTMANGGVMLNVSNPGNSPMRVQLSSPTDRWCAVFANFDKKVSIPWSRFNTACWDNSGSVYAGQPFTAVEVQFPGATTPVPYSFCVNNIGIQELSAGVCPLECAAFAAARCPAEPPLSDCLSSCSSELASQTACIDEDILFRLCFAYGPLDCIDGIATSASCAGAAGLLQECLNGAGGSSGAGGAGGAAGSSGVGGSSGTAGGADATSGGGAIGGAAGGGGATRNATAGAGAGAAGTTSAAGAVGTGGATSTGGAAGGGCTSSNAGAPACVPAAGTGSPGLIDDLNDGDAWILPNDGRHGVWSTFNDGTGTQTPPPFSTSCALPVPSGGKICTSGSGFNTWGAGIGLSLNGAFDCTAGLYDASAYAGVRFTLSGTVQSGYLRFYITTAPTRPLAAGGICPATSKCSDDYGVDITPAATPQTFTYYFFDLQQQGWGTPVAWNPAQMITLEWATKIDFDTFGNPVDTASFSEICLSDVAFF